MAKQRYVVSTRSFRVGLASLAFCAVYVGSALYNQLPVPQTISQFEGAENVVAPITTLSRPTRRSAKFSARRIEDALAHLGPCQGSSPWLDMPAAFCEPLTCLRSSVYPSIYLDVEDRGMNVVSQRAAKYRGCSEPTGGQLGQQKSTHFVMFPVQVSFIVPFRNHVAMTLQTLLELFRTAREASSVEFILVDEGSTENTEDIQAFGRMINQLFGIPFTLVRNEQPLGFGQAVNLGVHHAQGQYVVPFNNDALPTPGWLFMLLQTFKEFPNTGIAGPLFLYSDGVVAEAGGLLYSDGTAANFGRDYMPDRQHLFSRPVDYISAACIMARRQTWLQVNGFNPVYGAGYYEDTDLGMAIQQAGYTVQYQPASVIVHDEGGSLSAQKRQLMERNSQIFRRRWRDRLSALHCPVTVYPDDAAVRLAGARRMLWVDDIVPEPDHDSGSIRTMNMLRILRSLGFYISYQATASGRSETYAARARAMGIDVLPPTDSFDYMTYEGVCRFDVVVIARYYVYQNVHEYVKQACPGIPIIYDTVDVHFLREARVALTTTAHWHFPGFDELTAWIDSNDTAIQAEVQALRHNETTAAAQSAYTFVVSDQEKVLLHRFRPDLNIAVVSNVHEVDRNALEPPSRCSSRKGILFVGNFNHYPNQQAVEALVQDVLPLLKKCLPEEHDMVLHIVGSNAEVSTDLQHTQIPTVFHGYLTDEELRSLYDKVKVVVAPLMSGAGVKGKINQAMLYGVPVVGTPVAAEGMRLIDGTNAMLASSAAAFADKVLQVYNNCTLWERLVHGGFDNVNTHFSMATAKHQLHQVMQELGLMGPHVPSVHKCNYQIT